jgi:alpha-glucosidase
VACWNNHAVTDPTQPSAPQRSHDRDWWKTAVIYQIYPRSFADANGDGMGDLQGVVSRVGYLAELGVDAVWLSPFYPSALADGGYDVDDYRDVDPRIGTLADFDEMITALHAVDIKVLVDIVPNHSSNRHPWFVEALASPPGSPARHRYIFRDGEGPAGASPPTTGSRSSAARSGSPSVTVSGTSICSPPSSQISTGTTRRSERTSAPP